MLPESCSAVPFPGSPPGLHLASDLSSATPRTPFKSAKIPREGMKVTIRGKSVLLVKKNDETEENLKEALRKLKAWLLSKKK